MVNRIAQPVLNAAETGPVARLYGELLGMPQVHSDEDGFILIGHEQPPGIAFDRVTAHIPPRWPDPAYPQQVHFDIAVADFGVGEGVALANGALPLADPDDGAWRVFADPAGHPFCLYASDSAPADRGRIDTIWFDCGDADELAEFYQGLLGMEPEPVTRPGQDDRLIGRLGEYPKLGFHRQADYHRPAWPDPARPQQIHLDLFLDDLSTPERLGATALPQLAGWSVFADPAGHPFCAGIET